MLQNHTLYQIKPDPSGIIKQPQSVAAVDVSCGDKFRHFFQDHCQISKKQYAYSTFSVAFYSVEKQQQK